MREYRCPHPHPRIPNKRCNAPIYIEGRGVVDVGCPRCHEPIYVNLEKAGTESEALTASIAE